MNSALHSLFLEVRIEWNRRPVNELNQLFTYRTYMETVLNYCKEVQKNRLRTEGSVKDTAGKMRVTNVTGGNVELKKTTLCFATSAIVDISGYLHLEMFQQCRFLYPGIDVNI